MYKHQKRKDSVSIHLLCRHCKAIPLVPLQPSTMRAQTCCLGDILPSCQWLKVGIDHSWIRYVSGAPEGNSGNAGYSSAIHSVLAISGTLRGQACFGCEFRAGKRKAMTCNDIPKYSRRARGVKVRLHKFESLEVFFGTPHSYCSIPMFPMYPRHSKIRSRGFVVQLIGSSGRTIAKSARLQRRMSFHRSGGLAMGQKWWIYSKRLPIVRMAT